MNLDQIIWGNSIESYIIAFSIIALFLAGGQLFSKLVVGIIKKLASKTKTTLDDILIKVLEKPAVFALFIVGFKTASNVIYLGIRGQEIVTNIITILVVWNFTWVIIKLLDVLMDHYLAPLTSKKESALDDQLLPFVRKFLKFVAIVIGILFLLRNLGYDITSLVAGLGIGGLAFALAAQPLLSNLFGGLAILTDKPFRVGDRIRVDQKYEGYVKEIGLRSTTISGPTGTLTNIPNNLIATTASENLSTSEEKGVRFSFNIGLEYSTSSEKIEEAIKIITEILEKNENVVNNESSKPSVSFWTFDEYSLRISVVFAIHPPDAIGKVRTDINLDIKKKFEKAHIKFAFPTQTLHIEKNHEHK
ncbi:MAG TPA: mechanosensitive ion channel family protein [Allocoleopsis sp.]